MTEKQQLQAEIAALGEKLGVPVDTEQTVAELKQELERLEKMAGANEEGAGVSPEPTTPAAKGELMHKLIATGSFQTSYENQKIAKSKGTKFDAPEALAELLIDAGVAAPYQPEQD